jgi:hypothetical protein
VQEWDIGKAVQSSTMTAREVWIEEEYPLIISVRRESDRSVSVRLESADDPSPPHIHVDADVSAGESIFALFDSGAAVQQVGADYLISNDWLRRGAADDSVAPRSADWATQFETRLQGGADGFRYVESMDALRVAVVHATGDQIEPTAR